MKKVLLCIITLSFIFLSYASSFAYTPTPTAETVTSPTPKYSMDLIREEINKRLTPNGNPAQPPIISDEELAEVLKGINDEEREQLEKDILKDNDLDNLFGLGIDGLIKAVESLVDFLGTFFTDGVGGVVEKTLGDIFQSFVDITAIDGKWVFSTPTLINSDWVRTLWWIMFYISIGCLGIGIGVTMIRIISGKYKGHLRTALFTFLISGVLVSFSLLIADRMITFGNDLMNSYARSTLAAEAQKPENKPAMLLDNIDYNKIGFEYFDGESLVNLSFGSQLSNLDDPEYKMYKQFLTKNGGGGAIILVWAMLVIALIGIFGTLRMLVIGTINGLGPFWISCAAWTGNMRPVYGYINLNIRCIALSYVFDFACLICMYVSNHSGDFSIGKQLFATIIYTIALIIACKLFFRWVYRALKSPIDLGGGYVEQYTRNKMSRMIPAANSVLEKLGVEDSTESSDSDESVGERSSSSEGSQPEIKDRLSSAEQTTGKHDPNRQISGNHILEAASSKNQAAAAGENTMNIPNTSHSQEMKYDNTLRRLVKLPVNTHAFINSNNTSAMNSFNSYNDNNGLNKQNSNLVKTYEEHLSDYRSNPDIQKSYNGLIEPQPVKDVLKQASEPPVKQEPLKQESSVKQKPVKQESTAPQLNGGKILESIDKNGGGKK